MDQISIATPPFFDPAELRAELSTYWKESAENPTQMRPRVVRRLKELKATAQAEAEALLLRTGDGRACAAALALFQDELIKLIYDFSTKHLYRARNPSAAEHMALVATGGYGRGLMAPKSDVDLLFLLPYKQTAWGESIVESVLYFLWDLGYKVGHATRTVDQTLKAAQSDMTIRTALLDARLIHGEGALFDDMWSRFIANVVSGSKREFIAAKLVEREERLKRAGQSRYRVEPNIKEGKGGLRDLNLLHWLAVYLNPAHNGQKAENAIFTHSEVATFNHCEGFLWTIRCHLHFLTGKAEERLSFDVQPDMARRLRYHEGRGLLAVERFMKHYFLIAKDVGDLTRTVCSSLELRQLKSVPTLSDFVGALPWSPQAKIAATTDFRLDNRRLNVKQPDVFRKDPLNLIRFFIEAERENLLMHPEALRLIRASMKLIDDDFRRNREANRLFLDLLTSREAPENSLRYMNESGVLGRFIPEFGRCVAMMQFNMYHHYTVDEHTLQAIGILSRIEKGEFGKELPLSTEIINDIQNRNALYVALLMHDVAKAVEGDHSLVGADWARSVALRLGLSAAEAETAAWLVRHHLVMSQTAQSRDISDPQTIRNFADLVQSPERLKLLLLLTVADIRAVGPGVWNGWKGQLLRQLYYDTEPILAGGHTRVPRQARIADAKARLRDALSDWSAADVDRFGERHEPDYWVRTDLDRQILHASLIRRFETEAAPLVYDVRCCDIVRPIPELTFVTGDHPQLLMQCAGACAASGASIASAQIATTRDGLALDTLLFQRKFVDDHEEISQCEKIARSITDVVSGARVLDEAKVRSVRKMPKVDAFTVPPDIVIDNTASQETTVIEVHALDRPGLLYDLARGFDELGLDIASAHIATFGEKAVDVFYVTGPGKQKVTDEATKSRIRAQILDLLEE
ncbi:[protein-PII] uridylyltransferase [Rhodomicrobium sp.]|uniref:[protein-PII] uridylyltransferase n=1 Tax=Rhodomicrobium sp. TaxID=2720632 RepID=UPI0039E4CD2E